MATDAYRGGALTVDSVLSDLEGVLTHYRQLESHAPTDSTQVSVVELASRIYDARRARDTCFSGHSDLFGEPGWDILLDLFIAGERGRKVSVSSCCIAAAVPPTTALRWIGTLSERGLIEQTPDVKDSRRRFVALTPAAKASLLKWLHILRGRIAPT
ncbi:winged helix DNA-binding protein [Sphingomonas sp. S2-65]|uniref:winged helix DNA-binding protein n=1 Tax=Sphingomonas sp. S2-65 TaxID=2903960 RepID=UPI001F2EDCA1|nr:winged helix DNA-binding protein [Sphingomonas sp. S2-65]UYY57033.1 MarR family transcriptional regulator [Sphingomonas sp. S2-65]